jgi:hypothetical protein
MSGVRLIKASGVVVFLCAGVLNTRRRARGKGVRSLTVANVQTAPNVKPARPVRKIRLRRLRLRRCYTDHEATKGSGLGRLYFKGTRHI